MTRVSEEPPDAASRIVEATKRRSLVDAIAWLAEDHPMPRATNWSSLLRDLVELDHNGFVADRALRRVVREATISEVDTARIIFDVNTILAASEIRAAVTELLSRSEDGTFSGLTPRGVLNAQNANALSVDVLCLAAGVSTSEAIEWFRRGSTWNEADLSSLLSYLGSLMAGELQSPFPNAEPARGVEYLISRRGWALADHYQSEGVPYEVFLAQRSVGGAWLAHKNKTSSLPNIAAARSLCSRLQERKIDFRRSSTVGGSVRPSDLQALSGIEDKRVGLVVVNESLACYAVGFSTARDGGTARANGDGLLQIPIVEIPFALVLTGPGWSGRPETDRLARRFGGRLFTDLTLDELVQDIESVVS